MLNNGGGIPPGAQRASPPSVRCRAVRCRAAAPAGLGWALRYAALCYRGQPAPTGGHSAMRAGTVQAQVQARVQARAQARVQVRVQVQVPTQPTLAPA